MQISLILPPGVYRNGTEYQSVGRYYDASLVRWVDGTLRPIGGWTARSASAVTGKCRGIVTWRDNGGARRIGLGTHSGLHHMSQTGGLADITPAGFTAGNADAASLTGYGSGPYGGYTYGTARPDLGINAPASQWLLDTWGEYLVGCMAEDGRIWEWRLNTANDAAAIANAPTACRGVVVTEERFLFALGAGGNPRKVQWSDQENNTAWAVTATNQAGDYELQTPGRIMTAKRVGGSVLILTDVDAHVARYQGPPFVYGFERVGTGCGIISQQGVAVVDGFALWMGGDGFYRYNSYVEPLGCDVSDYVFGRLNRDQATKVACVHINGFHEVWWFYPSSGSTEVDSYVAYNYREGHWNIGALGRLCGTGKGAFNFPIMVDASGTVYDHETGLVAGAPYAETGPVEVSDRVMHVRSFIPDEATLGDVEVSFKTRLHPTGPETTSPAFSAANPTSIRGVAGKQIKVRYTQAEPADWRVGVPRIEYTLGGTR